ncbi:Uncharacterized protein TCAP_01746 [Tolypocladium capitatum]|uniref:Amino-acid permease n=1 Tax=Tolypocladium capitatum TaxID=45235 RepID=A0A2K3QLB6_9HYPO|nr:Uncharacterized protein TCAP_01746 [Tolypocladium capitatum]
MSSPVRLPAGYKKGLRGTAPNPPADAAANGDACKTGGAAEAAAETDQGNSLEGNDERQAATKSTPDDAVHMRRMGRSQELVRHFRLVSVASFVAVATAAWEIGLFEITPGLTGGGRPALVYSVLWNFVGFGPIYLSMAEMASMAPIAGAQYHWVSEFSPESLQKILSYLTGWTSTLAWQSGNAIGVFLVATIIQSIISINVPDYAFPRWHATLLVIGAVGIALSGIIFGSKVLPHWQNAVFAIYVVAYFVFIIPIWVNAPRVTSEQVWTGFEGSGGWPSLSLSVMIGQLSGIYTQLGVDAVGFHNPPNSCIERLMAAKAVHMSEEVKDAARSVPKAMMGIYVVNFCLIFPAILTVCYHISSVSDALADPTTYPTIHVLRQSMSDAWVTVILVIVVVLLNCSNITYLAAVSRDLFAFARDQGLPFSGWISRVDERRSIPQNACILTGIISICLGLIYIGNPVAFYAITSLLTVALLQCYSLSIGCLLWRRIHHPETLPRAQFPLGRFGIPTNAAAVAYASWGFFWSFWPQAYPVTAAGFNWSSVIFVSVLIVALVYYVFVAHRKYTGPVALVEGRKVHAS